MSFKLIDNHLTPAEGEIVVRSYHCTTLSPVFAFIGLKTNGYLTVTNKRVVYFAEGSSLFGATGNSKYYDEVPLADIANLSLRKGTRFSFLRLLAGLLFGQIPAAIVMVLLSWLMLMLEGAAGGSNPYLLRFGVFLQLAAAIMLVFRSLSVPRESIVRLMLAAGGAALVLSVPAFALAHGRGLPLLPSAYQTVLSILSIPTICYWLWCLYWFIRREYFIMFIRSKTNWPPAIGIVGVSWWRHINVTAGLACWMAPAIDTDALFKELGAMVTDMQTLGDMGIQKWQKIERDSIAKEADTKQETPVYYKTAYRYALATIILIGLFVGSESIWYASGVKQRLASQMRSKLASVRNTVESDSSIKAWVPKLLASADQEAIAGETAFGGNKFTDAMAHWKVAINTYSNIPSVATAMKKAFTLQSQYQKELGSVYLQEATSERLKPAFLMEAFTDLIDQHPSPNSPWMTVKKSATEAKALDEQINWGIIGVDWNTARSSLPDATRLMHADLWVKQAEDAIKKGDANSATNYAENALKEIPEYPDALQRKELAMNMIKYDQWLSQPIADGAVSAQNIDDFTKLLDMSGGEDWKKIKTSVENARVLANKNEWDKSNNEWENALSMMPNVILAMRLEKLETEARRGNWSTVSRLSDMILEDHPGHSRANELKKTADGIMSARAAALAYQRALSEVLKHEVANDYIKTGDMTDFVAHMDKYGQEEWAQVKDSVNKAEAFGLNEQGIESSNEWAKAYALFPSAVHKMRAGIWMEQADLAVKSTNWAKVLIYAEKALKEKPDHVRAKQLRDQADLIEKKRLMQTP
jgi:tetratricopeptide (TPR) repeat protein